MAQIFRAGHTGKKAIYLQGGSYLKGSHSLKGAEEGKVGLLKAPWLPRKAFWGAGKGQNGAGKPLRSPKRHPCEGGGEV